MNAPKRSAFRIVIMIFVSVISAVGYLLADRYLIQHVEIENVNAYAAQFTETLPQQDSAAVSQAAETQDSTSPSTTPQTVEVVTTGSPEPVVADDWNYRSEDVSIAITQHSMGSGSDQITYFVADVVLSDATKLTGAFANDQFGRNIIAYTSEIARAHNAIFAINGDYYGFRSDGIVIRNGVIYRDVPARVGLAFYRDGSMKIYDETETSAEELLAAGVWNTLSFGPALIENGEVAGDFGRVVIDTNIGNRSIQNNNPRTGVGIIDENHFVFIVVDGRSRGYSRGATLAEFAQIFKDLGCSDAYNIDGGGSSVMYFMGRLVNNPLGKKDERGTSDILMIGS